MAEFPAKYNGECAAGDQILPGQEVIYVDDELYHVECVDKPAESRRARFEGTTLEEMGY